MGRVTHKDNEGWYIHDQSIYYDEKRRGKEIDRLAAYEDTGLEPEEIRFKWVNVKDRLPEESIPKCLQHLHSVYVIAAIKYKDGMKGIKTCKREWNHFSGKWEWELGNFTVTHWMPFPEPPE